MELQRTCDLAGRFIDRVPRGGRFIGEPVADRGAGPSDGVSEAGEHGDPPKTPVFCHSSSLLLLRRGRQISVFPVAPGHGGFGGGAGRAAEPAASPAPLFVPHLPRYSRGKRANPAVLDAAVAARGFVEPETLRRLLRVGPLLALAPRGNPSCRSVFLSVAGGVADSRGTGFAGRFGFASGVQNGDVDRVKRVKWASWAQWIKWAQWVKWIKWT